jgi:RNA polymerase sigma-70 factor (ECF subfamily)
MSSTDSRLATRVAGAQPDITHLSDEDLLANLAAGQHAALAVLFERYNRRIFRLGAQSVGRAAAEDIVQDVFLELWRRAAAFDAQRGAFEPWLLHLAHWRILNELRRRRRQRLEQQLEDEPPTGMLDPSPEPEEIATQADRRATLRSAVAALPATQRQAVDLAFFAELSHQQVASRLNLPLGTAKTRIRAGIQNLRVSLAPISAALVVLVAVGGVAVQGMSMRSTVERDERAVALLTTSDIPDRRLVPVADGLPLAAHGHYRTRAGATLAVFSASSLPVAPAGDVYQAWARQDGRWTALGTLDLDPSGAGHLIAESAELASVPGAVELTLEASPGSASPSGAVVLAWTCQDDGAVACR